MRKTALVAGALYLITFVTSIPALPLYHDILHNQSYVLGSASDTGVLIGAVLEVLCALAGIATAVVLFPVIKRKSETAALGFVTARVLEASMIFVGVLSVLSIVTLHKNGAAGAETASLVSTGRSLVALHDWTFLLGPGIMPAVNALCLATVLYRTRLVPRIIPTVGLIGAPILLASAVAILFGAYDQVSSVSALTALPIAAWEFSLGVWLVVKGFRYSPVIVTDSTVVDLDAAAVPAGV
jgi:hypothetical protein